MTQRLITLVGAVVWCVTLAGQVPVGEAIRDLANPDTGVRLRAAQKLKSAANPEAAVPLAAAVIDPDDRVQLEAIAAELNIFLAEKVVPRKRVGLVIEVRNRISAEAAFLEGPLALDAIPVPVELVTALRTAARDENPFVAVEAMYAFGALAAELAGDTRREVLQVSAPELAGMVGVPESTMRLAAVRAIGRVFALRPEDSALDHTLGDAVIAALNEKDRGIRAAAMDALSAMRYERAVQALTDLVLYYGRGEIGTAALGALARIGHASSIPIFVQQLTAGNATSKVIAIEGLARLGDPGQLAAIRSSLARERNAPVLLAEGFASVLLGSGRLDPLFDALAKSKLRDQALGYLVELAPGRVASFAARSQDVDPRRRADVADILALAGDAAALPIVEPLRQDRDPQVVRAADRAVARLRRPS